MKTNIPFVLSLFLIVSIFFTGCKKEESNLPPPISSQQNELNENENILIFSDTENIFLTVLESDKLIFENPNQLIRDLEVNDVIVSGISENAPNGYLRRITEVSENNSVYEFNTSPVKLTEVFKTLEIEFTKILSLDDTNDPLVFDISLSGGNFSVESLPITANYQFHFDVDIGFFEIDHLKIGFEIEFENFAGSLIKEADFVSLTEELIDRSLPPITIKIPVGLGRSFPIIINPDLEVETGIECGAGEFSIDFEGGGNWNIS